MANDSGRRCKHGRHVSVTRKQAAPYLSTFYDLTAIGGYVKYSAADDDQLQRLLYVT